MQLRRKEVIAALNALSTIDRGQDGKPFTISFSTSVLIATITKQLRKAVEPYAEEHNKAVTELNAKRDALNAEEFAARQRAFNVDDQALLDEAIEVRLPKRKLTADDLKEVAIPPGALVELFPFLDVPAEELE